MKKLLTHIFISAFLIESAGMGYLRPRAFPKDSSLRPMATAQRVRTTSGRHTSVGEKELLTIKRTGKKRFSPLAYKTLDALFNARGGVDIAAKSLGIARITLYQRLQSILDIAIMSNTAESKIILEKIRALSALSARRLHYSFTYEKYRKAEKVMIRSRRVRDIRKMVLIYTREKPSRGLFKHYVYPYPEQEIVEAILAFPGLKRKDLCILAEDSNSQVSSYATKALAQYDGEEPYSGYYEASVVHNGTPYPIVNEGDEGVDVMRIGYNQLAGDLASGAVEAIENYELLEKLFGMAGLSYRKKVIFTSNIGNGESLESLGRYFRITRKRVGQIKIRTLRDMQRLAKVWNYWHEKRESELGAAPATTARGTETLKNRKVLAMVDNAA